jgi:dUTP pyrophosphatase
MPKAVKVRIQRLRPTPLPAYQTKGSAGLDLYAARASLVKPGEVKAIPTGIALEIPAGFEAQVRPRSGLALNFGIGILNAPGTIDSDYRGEVKVILFNFGKVPFEIKKMERIAQLVFNRVTKITWQEVSKLKTTKRGAGGFGHTG